MFVAVQDSHRYANDLILLFIMTLHSIVYGTLRIFYNFYLPKVIVIWSSQACNPSNQQ